MFRSLARLSCGLHLMDGVDIDTAAATAGLAKISGDLSRISGDWAALLGWTYRDLSLFWGFTVTSADVWADMWFKIFLWKYFRSIIFSIMAFQS